jgi:hypothetical protein
MDKLVIWRDKYDREMFTVGKHYNSKMGNRNQYISMANIYIDFLSDMFGNAFAEEVLELEAGEIIDIEIHARIGE